MPKKKCKEEDKNKPVVKDDHKYVCKSCGHGSKKEEKLCKPKKQK